MNNTWCDNRSRMLEQNVKTLITCKIATDFSCCDFYEKIKSNKDFLKKILYTEKYDWANVLIYKCFNIILFLNKMYYFSVS